MSLSLPRPARQQRKLKVEQVQLTATRFHKANAAVMRPATQLMIGPLMIGPLTCLVSNRVARLITHCNY